MTEREEEEQTRTEHTEREILNEYQARSLTIVLGMLERILFSLDDLLSDGVEQRDGIMVSLVNPLSTEQKARLGLMSARAREIIALLAWRFGLNRETADLAREVHGRLVEMWASLEDTRSHKLRRYGQVSPRLPEALDPSMDELIKLVLTMDRELFNARTVGPPRYAAQGSAVPATRAQRKEEAQDL